MPLLLVPFGHALVHTAAAAETTGPVVSITEAIP
jgi:hypothetical protein